MDYEELLISKVAWYYYFENLTQKNISELLGISRMKVIKLLEKAQETGVIQFRFNTKNMNRIELEQELKDAFNLKDVFIVPANPNPSKANATIAKAASLYISDRLTENCFINIGYGDTISKTINHLVKDSPFNISFVSLTGGVNYYLENLNNNLSTAKFHLLPAPLLASTKEMVDALITETLVKDISRLIKLSSTTIIGIGSLDDNCTISKTGILNKNDLLYLEMQGAVGDILSHFINFEGNLVSTHYESRLISTPLEILKELDNVIGIACGTQKVKAIKAVLKGGYLDVLITDEATALQLI